MNLPSVVRLLLLSAIWGASFLFMRIGAPVLGPVVLIFARVALAALFLLLMAVVLRRELGLRGHWRFFMVLALVNSALPFVLLAEAAKLLSASLLSMLNATAPLWAALIGAVWRREPIAPRAMLGLALGLGGVVLLAGVESLHLPAGGVIAIFAALGAAFCYGIATQYTRAAPSVPPFANALGSMAGATAWLLPALLISGPLPALPAAHVVISVVALGVVCSGVAYLLYFRLVADIGATSTLTVTYLVPVFGILWGVLFLDESVGWHTLAGGVIVLAGTALVTEFSLRGFLARRSI